MYMYLYIFLVDDRRGYNYIGVLFVVFFYLVYIYINLNKIFFKLNSYNLS